MNVQKPQKLYRLYSLVDDHQELGSATLEWFYHLREKPILPYDRLISGYHTLDGPPKEQAEIRVNQMFTQPEVDVLASHLRKDHGIESFLEEKTVPITSEYLLTEEVPEPSSGSWGSLYMFSREDGYMLPFEVWAWVHPREEVIDPEHLITKGHVTISWLARDIFTTFPRIVTGLHFYILECGCIRYQRRFMDGTLADNVNTYRDPEEGHCSKCASPGHNWKSRVIDEKVVYDFKVEIDVARG